MCTVLAGTTAVGYRLQWSITPYCSVKSSTWISERIEKFAMKVERRLFIGGLGENITEDDIKRCFQRFGEIENIEAKVKTNASGTTVNKY